MEQKAQNVAPAVFIGHGAPFFAIQKNAFTPTWTSFMGNVPALTAVICISGHWQGPGLAVTANENPKTIYDFGGFDDRLYQMTYPARGSPDLCKRVQELLAP